MNQPRNLIKLTRGANTCEVCHAKDLCMSSCLNENDFLRFEGLVGHRTPMHKGDRLFMAGENIKAIYILHSGSVKSYVESYDGDNQITGFHLPGDVIGIHGIEKMVHTDTVEALETSSICELKFNNINDICTAFPKLQKQFTKALSRELDHEQEMMLVLGKMSAERRMAHFLRDISVRLAKHGLSEKRINLTMTRHDVANYLSLAVETVSRILTRFQALNIILVDRRSITILDDLLLDEVFNNHIHINEKQSNQA